MKAKQKEYLFKLVIIGDAATGKSSLLRRYCENAFADKYVCTVGVDFHIKILKMKDQRLVKLQIWDTAGQEKYNSLQGLFYRGSDGCIIVFDITNMQSFQQTLKWKDDFEVQCSLRNPEHFPFVIIGRRFALRN